MLKGEKEEARKEAARKAKKMQRAVQPQKMGAKEKTQDLKEAELSAEDKAKFLKSYLKIHLPLPENEKNIWIDEFVPNYYNGKFGDDLLTAMDKYNHIYNQQKNKNATNITATEEAAPKAKNPSQFDLQTLIIERVKQGHRDLAPRPRGMPEKYYEELLNKFMNGDYPFEYTFKDHLKHDKYREDSEQWLKNAEAIRKKNIIKAEAERIAAEKAEAERIAAEKADAEVKKLKPSAINELLAEFKKTKKRLMLKQKPNLRLNKKKQSKN